MALTLPTDKFCVLPWISLETSPIGSVRPCCLYDGEIVNSQSVKFDLNKDQLKDVQNSEYMYKLRTAFLQGTQPVECRRCWTTEENHLTSKRMHTLDRLKDILKDETEWTIHPKDLMFLDLKLGNICNIACRICGAWSSSTYAGEEIKSLPVEERRNSWAYQMNRKGNWPRKSLTFWEDLHYYAPGIRYIEFTGGEPFMIREHFDFLDFLIEHDYAKNIEIHYNTNTTIYPDNDSIWKNFKHVEIAFSVDDIGNRFEYQRWGATWKTANKNIESFKKLKERNNNISLQVCSTINAFNVLYLEDLANWIDEQHFDFVYWNMLHDPEKYCITSLPAKTKLKATERLLSAQVSDKHKKEFKNVALFMNSKDGNTEALCSESLYLDNRRNITMYDYLPELAECLYGKA